MPEPRTCKILLDNREISSLLYRSEGEYVYFSAFCPLYTDGIYRLYIRSAGADAPADILLGVLAPENGRLAVRKKKSQSALRKAGIDPEKGLCAYLRVKKFEDGTRSEGPAEYIPLADPGAVLNDPALLSSLSEAREVLYRRCGGNLVEIAVPFDGKSPVGLAPAFTVLKMIRHSGKTYAVVDVSADGLVKKQTQT